MIARGCLLLLLACSSCSTAPPRPADVPVDLGEIRTLVWHGEDVAALETLEPQRWSRSGDVAGERLRQDLRLRTGARSEVHAELEDWQGRWPDHPDLAYLEARILEDPYTRRDRFRALVRSFPMHAWIRFGAIATAQQMGDWSRAERWLASPTAQDILPAWRRLLEARQAQHLGDFEAAFLLLEGDAFEADREASLRGYLAAAQASDDAPRTQRALLHMAVLQARGADLTPAEAIDLAFERLLAEWPWCGQEDLGSILQAFDAWLQETGAPSGWAEHPRYALAGVAQLVRPESNSGALAREWNAAGRSLLAGSAWGRGNEIHLLKGARSVSVDWPGHSRPIEVLVAAEVQSTAGRTAQGGTVFRGFYILEDSLAREARRLQSQLEIFQARREYQADQELPEPMGRMESLDLPQRLRLATLEASGWEVLQFERVHLCLHEAGHLREILHWLDEGLPVGELLPAMLGSRQRFGDPLLWLEYRAQLRTLASGRIPRWVFAEILERGQDPTDPYFRPYRRVLLDLMAEAERQGWGHLSRWDTYPPEEFVRLAQATCRAQGIEPTDALGVQRLLEALVQAEILKQLPADRSPAEEIDQGQVKPGR